MNRTLIAAGLATALFTAPALADCAADLTKIATAMKTATLDEAGSVKAKDLIKKAMDAETAKDEAACTTASTEMMKMLGLKTQ